jgi:hypothetical protein
MTELLAMMMKDEREHGTLEVKVVCLRITGVLSISRVLWEFRLLLKPGRVKGPFYGNRAGISARFSP